MAASNASIDLARRVVWLRGVVYVTLAAASLPLMAWLRTPNAVALFAILAVGSALSVRRTGLRTALMTDVTAAVALWWVFGPLSGADFLLFYAVAVGALLLGRRAAVLVTLASLLATLAQVGLHFLAGIWTLPIFHSPDPVPLTQFLASSGVKLVLLAGLAALFLAIAGMLQAGHRAIEEDLERQLELHRLKDQFVATVSHELRTPLTSLRGFTEAMLEDDYSRPEQVEFLGMMAQQAQELHALLEDLIAFGQAQAGRLAVFPEELDLAAEVREALVSFGARAASVDNQVIEKIRLRADPLRLRQILRNLVDNGLKYGGNVRISATRFDGHVSCVVRDDGPGVPNDMLERIFEPYGRLVDDRTMSRPGIGLGLPLARALAEAHGGSLVYVPGEDATFELILPA
ncbi:MAG: sensor histidine kinase [Acidimicrobiia bacterium]